MSGSEERKFVTSYIDDGYSRDDGYIAASEKGDNGELLYDSLSFAYRPATRRESIIVDAKINKASFEANEKPELAVATETIACEFVIGKLISWDLKDRAGNAVKITVDAMMRLHARLFNALYLIVRGNRTSDAKPPAIVPETGDAEQLGNSERVSG